MRIMEIIADTTNKIAEGEVLQLITKNNPNSTEQNYLQVIENKTAILFQAAAQCGAILGGAESAVEDSLKRFGMHLGTAFQLVDDVLDYGGDTQAMGKNIGDDLAEGKPTLPLIYAMEHANEEQLAIIRQGLKDQAVSEQLLEEVILIVRQSGALDYTRQLAQRQADAAQQCLQVITDSKYRDALQSMVEFSIERSS